MIVGALNGASKEELTSPRFTPADALDLWDEHPLNPGDNADTAGAVCGQLAGAFYGEAGIPLRWLERLRRREMIGGDGRATLDWERGNFTRRHGGHEDRKRAGSN